MGDFEFTMLHPAGMHARLAGILATRAIKWEKRGCRITISKGNNTAGAAQLMKLMALGIKKGDLVIVSAEGEEENFALDELLYFFAAFSQVHFNPDVFLFPEDDDSKDLQRMAESPRTALSIFQQMMDEEVLNGPKADALKREVAVSIQTHGRYNSSTMGPAGETYLNSVLGEIHSLCADFGMPDDAREMLREEFLSYTENLIGYTIRYKNGNEPWLVPVRKGDSLPEQERRPASGTSRPAAQSAARSQSAVTEQPKQQEEEGSLAGGFVLLGFALTLAAVGSFVVLSWFPGAQTVATIVLGLLITAGFAGLFAELDHVVPGIVAGLVVQAFLLHYIWSMGNRVILPTLLVGIALVVVPALLTSEK